ncbi:MAG: ribosome maturation factor RimM [Pseudomonadota bacterium]
MAASSDFGPDKDPAPRLVELAAITGAHGVSGDVRLKLLGEGIEALRQHTSFNDGSLTLKSLRSDNKGGAIACFAQVSGRAAAEKLRGIVLTVTRDALPDLAEDEYYHADLIGLAVKTDKGNSIGRITAVQNFGATDIIEILREPPPAKGMKSIMVPMTKAAVIEWDDTRLVIAEDFADQ